MTIAFHRPRDAAEALALLREGGKGPGGRAPRLPLGGGTQLNSSETRGYAFEAVTLEGIVPKGVEKTDAGIEIGAGTTFQQLLESPNSYAVLKDAARGMADRNIRNRATVGGNLGADKSCASLIPVFLALDAGLSLLDGRTMSLEAWLELPPGPEGRGVVTGVSLEIRTDALCGYARWSRVSCDLAVLGASAAYRLEGGRIRGLRLVLGGVAPHARRYPALEAALEGSPLPSREEIEAVVGGTDPKGKPFVSPIDDARAGAAFKKVRIAQLVADAVVGAMGIAVVAGGDEDRAGRQGEARR